MKKILIIITVFSNIYVFGQVKKTTKKPAVADKTIVADLGKEPIILAEGTKPSVLEIPKVDVNSLEVKASNSTINSVRVGSLTEENEILPIGIELAFNKTTSLVFPTTIRSVDLGSKSIIADKALNIENVLNVKASMVGFNETNFSVITDDGKFYSFICNYNEYPKSLAYSLVNYVNNANPKKEVDIKFNQNKGDNISDVIHACDGIMKKRESNILSVEKYDIEFKIVGLYIKNNTYYIKYIIKNYSNINYDIDFNKFYILDERVLKLASSQEYEIVPIYRSEKNKDKILSNSIITNIYAFDKFTIPNNKVVKMMLNEKNGGRHLELLINYHLIETAKIFK